MTSDDHREDAHRELDAPEQELWAAFGALIALLPARLDRQLQRDSGMSMFEYYVLDELDRSDHATLKVSALASCTESSLPRMSKFVARLEHQGKVTRWDCPSDGRATNVTLTDAGRAALFTARPGHLAALRDFVFAPLDDSRREQLHAISTTLLEHLDSDRSATPARTLTAAPSSPHRPSP